MISDAIRGKHYVLYQVLDRIQNWGCFVFRSRDLATVNAERAQIPKDKMEEAYYGLNIGDIAGDFASIRAKTELTNQIVIILLDVQYLKVN